MGSLRNTLVLLFLGALAGHEESPEPSRVHLFSV